MSRPDNAVREQCQSRRQALGWELPVQAGQEPALITPKGARATPALSKPAVRDTGLGQQC